MIDTAVRGAHLKVGPSSPVIDLPAINGAIIGYLFDRSGRHRLTALETAEQLAIFSTNGRHLIDHYSGAYAAIWTNPPDGSISVLRDPTGMVPILVAARQHEIIVASDLALMPDIPLVVDRQELARTLWHPDRASASRPLAGITEILPGNMLRYADGAIQEMPCWSPYAFLAQKSDEAEAHADHIAQAIDDAVAGWASLGPAVLELSGGLDSSILAASLTRSGQTWQAFTFATQARDGDEREHARVIASHCEAELVEASLLAEPEDAVRPIERLLARPSGMASMRGIDRLVQRHAPAGHNLFSGGGGDNVFAMLSSTGPARDAWRLAGIRAAWATMDDLAILHGGTRWQVMLRLMRRLWLDTFHIHRSASNPFLRSSTRLAPPDHAWFSSGNMRLPGASAHIASIAMVQTVLDAHDRYASRLNIFPLLSQPVMEACLSVPSYLWCRGGRDRAVARTAFETRLPPSILARRTKGRLESMLAAIYDGARQDLRPLLLDGRLASYGLLNMAAVEVALNHQATSRDWTHAHILKLADAELWVRSVEGRRRKTSD